MATQYFPVLALLAFDFIVLLGAVSRKSTNRKETAFLCVLFFFSGMPALIYQIVWQRVLFAIYGVNAESVAVVVSAFMLGLGMGSLAGGWLSSVFPMQAIILFGVCELGVASFGLFSLRIFHFAAGYTAGANLPSTIVFSLLLLILPTMLMGATLPLLVGHLVRFSGRVGYSVATLYFVNTFGSAVACYLCAVFLLRDFRQSGSIGVAACVNLLVGATALLLGRNQRAASVEAPSGPAPATTNEPQLPLPMAMLLAGLSGFIGLGFEIAWFRIFALTSSDRAPAFALLLTIYLAGIAAGSYVSGKVTEAKGPKSVTRIVGILMLLAGAISVYLPPLVAVLKSLHLSFLLSAYAFCLTAALMGSVFPLLCRLAVSAKDRPGRGVSLVYVSNIIGCTLGSLVIGFVLMHHLGLRQVSLQLGMAAVITGSAVLFFSQGKLNVPPAWAVATVAAALIAVPAASPFYSNLFEKLILYPEKGTPFAHIVENRNGVIAVTQRGSVFGDGVYDGYFNVDPTNDVNLVVRAYALSFFHPAPKRMLMIGLSSGSWAQILANHPQTESLDIIEINPGYLRLIPHYPAVRSILQNPKVHIYVDDGRRWLLAHSESRYDAIIANATFYWRNHASDLLSVEYLELVRRHLNPGGVYYYNTTGSDDAVATGLRVFRHGLRVLSFLAVSDSPIEVNKDRWISILRQYKIDDRLVFDPAQSQSEATLATYMALTDSLQQPPVSKGLETSESLNARLGKRLIITDDNMGGEWRERVR